MKSMKQKIAIINWVDASIHGSDTFTRKEAEESWLMTGVVAGFLVKEDEEKVVIAMDWFPKDDTFRTVQVYPKSGIKHIKRMDVEQACEHSETIDVGDEDHSKQVCVNCGKEY